MSFGRKKMYILPQKNLRIYFPLTDGPLSSLRCSEAALKQNPASSVLHNLVYIYADCYFHTYCSAFKYLNISQVFPQFSVTFK